jgi:hypothetical protein
MPTSSTGGPKGPDANASTAELFGGHAWTETDCKGVEVGYAVPMATAQAAMPPGFTPASLDGGATGLGILLGIDCATATGYISADGEKALYLTYAAIAPEDMATGNDFIVTRIVSKPPFTEAFAAAGFQTLDGTSTITLQGQSPVFAGTAAVVGTGLSMQLHAAGSSANQDPSAFQGRMFAVTDSQIRGVLDFKVYEANEAAFGPGDYVVTSGTFDPAAAGALIGVAIKMPGVDVRISGLPIPPPPPKL